MNTKYPFQISSILMAVTILFCPLLPASAKAQTTNAKSVALNPADTEDVIHLFTTFNTTDLPSWLHSTLAATMPPQSDSDSFARATWLSQLHIVQDETTCARLKEQTASVLKLFGADKTVRFFIYYDDYPNIQTIAGSFLGLSTGLVRLLKRDTADNAQLIGLVAHELARRIQQERFITAWKNEDLKTLRAFELFYDAVATATLNHLRLPSQQYALILQRMIAHATLNNTDRTRHPDLEQRQSVIRTIALSQSAVTEIRPTLN